MLFCIIMFMYMMYLYHIYHTLIRMKIIMLHSFPAQLIVNMNFAIQINLLIRRVCTWNIKRARCCLCFISPLNSFAIVREWVLVVVQTFPRIFLHFPVIFYRPPWSWIISCATGFSSEYVFLPMERLLFVAIRRPSPLPFWVLKLIKLKFDWEIPHFIT